MHDIFLAAIAALKAVMSARSSIVIWVVWFVTLNVISKTYSGKICLLHRPYQYLVAQPCPYSVVWSAVIEKKCNVVPPVALICTQTSIKIYNVMLFIDVFHGGEGGRPPP